VYCENWILLGEIDHPKHITRKEKKRKTQNVLKWEHNIIDRARARSTYAASGGASRA